MTKSAVKKKPLVGKYKDFKKKPLVGKYKDCIVGQEEETVTILQ